MNEQQNSRLVQDAYAAFKRGDITALLNMMADDVSWLSPGPKEIPVSGQRRGREQVKQFFAILDEMQEAEQFDANQFVAQGDTVVALGHYRWRVKSTGQSFEGDFAHVFSVKNGKVESFQEFFDTHVAVLAYSGRA